MTPQTTHIAPPDIGEVAPDFTVPDATETLRRLSELCGERPLLLVFYRGHW
jgi:peroxiredoxin